MRIRSFVITTAILLAIMVVFGAAAFALNLYTGPIIEANNAGAELAPAQMRSFTTQATLRLPLL